MSAMARMAAGSHKTHQGQGGDTVVLSSKFIPGNERAITNIINRLYKTRRGCHLRKDIKNTCLRPRLPGRTQADDQPDQAQIFHPDSRRIPAPDPARPVGRAGGRSPGSAFCWRKTARLSVRRPRRPDSGDGAHRPGAHRRQGCRGCGPQCSPRNGGPYRKTAWWPSK